jgi:hypothetical protein
MPEAEKVQQNPDDKEDESQARLPLLTSFERLRDLCFGTRFHAPLYVSSFRRVVMMIGVSRFKSVRTDMIGSKPPILAYSCPSKSGPRSAASALSCFSAIHRFRYYDVQH